jgi:hypothetical protein
MPVLTLQRKARRQNLAAEQPSPISTLISFRGGPSIFCLLCSSAPAALLRMAVRDQPEARSRLRISTVSNSANTYPFTTTLWSQCPSNPGRFILPELHGAGKPRLWDKARTIFPHLYRTARQLNAPLESKRHLRNRVCPPWKRSSTDPPVGMRTHLHQDVHHKPQEVAKPFSLP